MNILALEPYYGGSHKAFLDGWRSLSKHNWTPLTLPAYKWKWRMRHSAVTFADQVKAQLAKGRTWDIVFCSDMLNLAEFLGLVPLEVSKLPTVAYFHENQLTYPARFESERDYQFVMTNITTALAADSVWFNSTFHMDSFLKALPAFLSKMPDYQLSDVPDSIRAKADVYPQGIGDIKKASDRKPGPARILWAARWEHDKNPEDFFHALKILKEKGFSFRISVIGQHFRQVPDVFDWAKNYFTEHIDHWGYQKNSSDYAQALLDADLVVSTADHEFFGISVVEAIAAGAWPVLPKRLAYPEILGLDKNEKVRDFFYNGTVPELAGKLQLLTQKIEKNCLWTEDKLQAVRIVERFKWDRLTPILDNALEKIFTTTGQ